MSIDLPSILAATGNSFILLGVLVMLVFAVAYGMLTRKGSGIDKHPSSDQKAPGEEDPSEAASVDKTEDRAMNQHGTK